MAALLKVKWDDGSENFVQPNSVEPLFEMDDILTWKYDTKWFGSIVSEEADEVEIKWDQSSRKTNTVKKKDLILFPGRKAVVKWKSGRKRWQGTVIADAAEVPQILTPLSSNTSRVITSILTKEVGPCCICKKDELNQFCAFCSLPCHGSGNCGSYLDEETAKDVICSKCDRSWFNVGSTPRHCSSSGPNLPDELLERLESEKKDRKRLFQQEKCASKEKENDPDYTPGENLRPKKKKVATVQKPDKLNAEEISRLVATKKRCSTNLEDMQNEAQVFRQLKKQLIVSEIQTDDKPGDEVLYAADGSDSEFIESDDDYPLANLGQRDCQWSDTDFECRFQLPEKVGLNVEAELPDFNHATPADYFFLFFDRKVFNLVVSNSNLYVTQAQLKSGYIDDCSLSKYMGFLLYSSCVDLGAKDRYWSDGLKQSAVTEHLTKNTMKMVKAALHFNDNALEPAKNSESFDNLYKVRPLVEALNENFGKAVQQELEQCVDEQMTLYKGRKAPQGLKQYMPGKPIQHGFKNWARCGASGYTYEIQFYQGKSSQENENEVGNKCAAVVLNLTKELPKGSFLFVDNLFATLDLVKHLGTRGINVVCTFRRNRLKDASSRLTSKKDFEKQERGFSENTFDKVNNIEIVQWLDTKPVILVSNFVGIQPETECERWDKKLKEKKLISMPHIVQWYNRFMGGVDLSDMLIGLHAIPFRYKKWYHRIFARLLDQSAINAWLVYRAHSNGDYMSLYNFKLALAQQLLHGQKPAIVDPTDSNCMSTGVQYPESNRKMVQPQYVSYDTRKRNSDHMPIYGEKVQRCRNRCNIKTYWFCRTCEVYLCLQKGRNCFVDYHDLK